MTREQIIEAMARAMIAIRYGDGFKPTENRKDWVVAGYFGDATAALHTLEASLPGLSDVIDGRARIFPISEYSGDALSEIEFIRQRVDYDPETGLFCWKIMVNPNTHRPGVWFQPSTNGDGYPQIRLNKRTYKAHRTAWLLYYGEWPTMYIDHIDGDKTNNRISNLRLATSNLNAINQGPRKSSKSGIKGVSPRGDGTWRATITRDRKRTNIGTFATQEEAAAAYHEYASKVDGEFYRPPAMLAASPFKETPNG